MRSTWLRRRYDDANASPVEWPEKLRGTLLETAAAQLPAESWVIAVEDGERLVGCVALFPVWHLEGVWIAPEQRGRVGVARRLVSAIRAAARALGLDGAWMMARSEASARMCKRFGSALALDCQHFAVTFKE